MLLLLLLGRVGGVRRWRGPGWAEVEASRLSGVGHGRVARVVATKRQSLPAWQGERVVTSTAQKVVVQVLVVMQNGVYACSLY